MTCLRFAVLILVALLLLGTSGCGGDGSAGPDAGDGAMPGDAGPGDAGPDGSTPDAGAPPACPTTTTGDSSLEPLPVDQWLRGGLAVDGSDPTYDALRQDQFEMPQAGRRKYGTHWIKLEPDDEGNLDPGGFLRVVYFATEIEVDTPTRVVMRADAVSRVFVNGRQQPGDVYGSGDKRVPIRLDAGTNQLVLRASPRRGPRVQLWKTEDALQFNTEDVTVPDLRVGDDATQYVGVPVLNSTPSCFESVEARVVETDHFAATTVSYPALGPRAVTQLAFRLEPKAAWSEAGQTIAVDLRVSACDGDHVYETSLELETVSADATFRRSFRSPVDGSVQYYGVVPPESFDPERDYGMVLSLHGASVEAIGQAGAYSPKEWTYIIAPTNRRPFGFDWEEWGRLNGLAALEDAMEAYRVDPTRVYVTGHSMGGHGTWHFGVMHPGRFATVSPSAGWSSFYSYGGSDGTGTGRPPEPFESARAHSDTLNYIGNLARRGAYILHGSEDRNVPVSQGRMMRDEVSAVTDDVVYHEQPGAEHWWDGDMAEGTDCVDWPPMFDFMQSHTLDPYELDFTFRTPGPWVSREHSYVRIHSAQTPMEDSVLESEKTGDAQVTLTTTNVRAMDLDGAALSEKGITEVVVDGTSHEVMDATIELGTRDGKGPGVSGPFNQAFHRPFCFVYPNEGPPEYREYAGYLLTTWALRGNGHACAVPLSRVTAELRERRNLVYLGVPFEAIEERIGVPVSWDGSTIELGEGSFEDAAVWSVFPDGDRLSAAVVATEGSEHLIFDYHPFSSRAGMPDYFVRTDEGFAAAGFFDASWGFDPAIGAGPW